MIPSITHHKVYPTFASPISPEQIACDPNFEGLTFSDKLKSIGMIDEHFNLLFNPSEIPAISEEGQRRFEELMKQDIPCCTDEGNINIKQSDYISGFGASLKNTGIKIQTYLRGGSAAYVADLNHYFEFLIQEFLAAKKLPKDLLSKELEALKSQKEEVPHDVDIFDQVLNDKYPATGLELFYIEFLKRLVGQGKKIRFIQRLIPEVSPLFPHPENYVLFTLGDPEGKFQTDRIIGKLRHEYLHMRDNIRIKIIDNQMCTPESAGNFWQMVIDRKLKIVRTENWHKEDFRAGLAALQLILDGHILIEDNCALQSILENALSTGDEKVFTGAISRAKLHSKDPTGFLMSVLIAFSHTASIPAEHLKILMDAIGEIPPLPSLYKYALLQTLYNDKTCSAEWDPSGFLILYRNNNRIVFPKNFCLMSTETPFFSSKIGAWIKTSSCANDPVYQVLDGELSYLERVLFELAIQKPDTPLTESMMEALVEYIVNSDSDQERKDLGKLLPKEFSASPLKTEWVKSLLKYSFKHGLKLWNALKIQMDDKKRWAAFEENILHIVKERPNQSYVLLEEESPPKELRLKILKNLISHPLLSLQTSVRLIEELIDGKALGQDTVAFIIQKYKNTLKTYPQVYIKFIKQFQLNSLAKEWMESFPNLEKMGQALLFFKEYSPPDHSLLEIICSLPGLHEHELLEALYLKGFPVFQGRNASNLLALLKLNFLESTKKEILKTLAKISFTDKEWISLERWMKANPPLSLELSSYLLEKENALPYVLNYLIHLKTAKNPLSNEARFAALWLRVIDTFGISPKLIPFFQNRGWVKSVYKEGAEVKTKEWGETLIKQGNLKKIDFEAVEDILSRTNLHYTPLVLLKYFLESIEESVTKSLKRDLNKALEKHLKLIQEETSERRQHFEIFVKLIKLGMASKLLEDKMIIFIEEAFAFVPLLTNLNDSFDPLFDLLQTLPLIDYGTEERYNQWIKERNELYLKWQGAQVLDNFYVREIKGSKPLKILSYTQLQESLKYSHLLKLNLEHYIENKISKEDFKLEVRELALSAAKMFKTDELMPHEDPCLICIHDFSHLLKSKTKRIRVYEAFDYMIKQWKRNRETESIFIKDQKNYLEIRQTVEDFITTESTAVIKNRGLYAENLNSIHQSLKNLCQTFLIPHIHTHDPVLDAFELDSLHPMNKIDLLNIWSIELELIHSPHYYYHAKRVRSLIQWEKAKLKEQDIIKFFDQKIELLKRSTCSVVSKYGEGLMMFQSANLFLEQNKIEQIDKIRGKIEQAMNAKIPEELIPQNKSPDKLLDSIAKETLSHVSSVIQEENPQYFSFYSALALVKKAMEVKPNYFIPLRLMQTKAPLFLLELENKVVFDPYVNFLQSLALVDISSEKEFNNFNREKEEFYQLWLNQLEFSEKQNFVLHAQESPPLEFLSYGALKATLICAKQMNFTIEQFVNQKITEENFKTEINDLCIFASKNIPVQTLTKHSDPCLTISPNILTNRMRGYTAINYLHDQWIKTMPLELPYINEHRSYLNMRRETEDILLDQLDLLKKDEIVHFEFFNVMINYFETLLGSDTLKTILMRDPVSNALSNEILSPVEKNKLLFYWGSVLSKSKAPMEHCQSIILTDVVRLNNDLIGEKNYEQFLYTRIEKLNKLEHFLDKSRYDAERQSILSAALLLPKEKINALHNKLNTI